ncbi:hypothetical protein EDD21DRAFT_140932 [Dissophora ornata]|nr:hypothetical protein EDD21DRAFT_140932 [Dissophora ornata]
MFFDLLSPVQWGFYFNASNKDQGSNDLMQLVEYLDEKTLGGKGPSVNTVFARNMARVLFLSRLLILKYCLQVPNCHQTFSSASWAILQVCPVMFEDVFLRLLSILYDRLEGLAILESDLRPIVRHELHTVQKSLAAHDYPNFSIRTKLRLVIDEAQILGDKCSGLFQSSLEDDLRPMLSAVLNGFRKAGGQDDFTILYCGTGLSIRTLHWALSSGYGVKEYNPTIIPSFIEFPGWTSPDSVQSYVDQIKDQLSDDGSKSMVDALIPPAAVDMLYKKACWSLPSNRNGN